MAIDTSNIPVVILAGGRGARFDHESQLKPKPMIVVAGKPMLQHIIDSFAAQGFNRFIIATGYLSEKIIEYFYEHGSCSIRDEASGRYCFKFEGSNVIVECVYTGMYMHTGERVAELAGIIGNSRFILTYGDGLSDVDISKVIEKHEKKAYGTWWGDERPPDPNPALITVTTVKPAGRFGAIEFDRYDDWGVGQVKSFQEKPNDAWINGGFMVVEPQFIEGYLYVQNAVATLESEAMSAAAHDGFMRAYKHDGYWRCMDTRRDLEQIEDDVAKNGGKLPWMREGQ